MKSIIIWGEEGDEHSHINEIISGRQTAFCVPQVWYGKAEGEQELEEGEQVILKDPSKKERLLIEITKKETIRFGDANERLAKAELDCDLQDFRDSHRYHWEEDLKLGGIVFDDNLPLVVEYFKIVSTY